MTERTLFQFTLSPYCIKARRILEFKRLAYRTVEVNPFRRGEVLRISGQKHLPVLVDGNARTAGEATVVADSTRIAEYLDARYPDPPVYPRDASARARVAMLEDWSDETFAGNLIPFKIFTPGNARRMVAQSRGFYPPRPYNPLLVSLGPFVLRRLSSWRLRGRDLPRLQADYERDLDLLEVLAAASTFLAGDQPTVFDFAVWGLLRTMEGLDGQELLERRPHLASWYLALKGS